MHLEHFHETIFPCWIRCASGPPSASPFFTRCSGPGPGFRSASRVSSAPSPPMFYTRPPRPSRGSAGWALRYSLLFPVSSSRIPRARSSPTEFLLGRALRLYPAVWVCATATLLVLLLFGSGPASEFILPYIHAMLLVPEGVTRSMARRRLLDAGGRDGVLWAGVLRDADEENHPAAPRLRPHHLERRVQRCRVAGPVLHDASRPALVSPANCPISLF